MSLHRKQATPLLIIGLLLGLTTQALAATISQGFNSVETLPVGTLVSISKQSNSITQATITNQTDLFGIVVATNDSTLAIDSSKIQVVTNGVTNAFVTDLNGPIKKDDPIAVSPIDGIGMKAIGDGEIVGFAERSTKDGAGTPALVESRDGKSQKTTIQDIPINVSVQSYNPLQNGGIPSPLQNLADNIAGKPVSIARVIISILVLLFATLAVTLVLYTGIHNGFISLGRNPLAKKAINRALVKTIIAATFIVICALCFAYFVVVS